MEFDNADDFETKHHDTCAYRGPWIEILRDGDSNTLQCPWCGSIATTTKCFRGKITMKNQKTLRKENILTSGDNHE